MGTYIVMAVLAVAIVFAVISSRKHMKGEGGCCGGGGGSIVESEEIAELKNPVVAKKIIHIEGMHCDNCKNSVTRSLQRIEGVSALVNLSKKQAIVTMDREIDDAQLRFAVERIDFVVTEIEHIDVL